MRMIFCADSWNRRQPEAMYADEVAAATQLDIPFSLLDFSALVEQQDDQRAVRRIAAAEEPEVAIYRGWMLKPDDYTQLYGTLAEKNLFLINMPQAYIHCHYLPEVYPFIQEMTPQTVWLHTTGQVDMAEIMALLQPFGNRPVIVKDFVKSRKHEWLDACYIPSASSLNEVERVVKHFIQLQGEDLAEGLVFREFLSFEPLGRHAKSGMPLSKEYRLFFCDGQHLLTVPYWEEGHYGVEQPPLELLLPVVRRIQSRFFTIDVARQLNGNWTIIEAGDGQVAGLPEHTDVRTFYQALVNIVRSIRP